jgi:hypothetical protein
VRPSVQVSVDSGAQSEGEETAMTWQDIVTADGGPSGVVNALTVAHPGLIRGLARANSLSRTGSAPMAGAA